MKRRSHAYYGDDARPRKIQKAIEPFTESLHLLLMAFLAFVRRLGYRNRYEGFFLTDLSMIDD